MLLKHLVRLACIRHAASVHPEPGSNSPQKIFTLASVSYGFTDSTKLLLPITLQLLRCLPFERAVFYLLDNRFVKCFHTLKYRCFFLHRLVRLRNQKHMVCVSNVGRLLSCHRFVWVTKSFSFLLAKGNYMHSREIVNSKTETQP